MKVCIFFVYMVLVNEYSTETHAYMGKTDMQMYRIHKVK